MTDNDKQARRRRMLESSSAGVRGAIRAAMLDGTDPASVVVLVLDVADSLGRALAEGLQPEKCAEAAATPGALLVTFAQRRTLLDPDLASPRA